MSRDLIVIDDDFEEMAEFGRTHRQSAPTPESPSSAWERLVRGQTIGKSVNVRYVVPGITEAVRNFAPNDILTISGEDKDACQMTVQLSPPRVVRTTGLTITDVANVASGQDNVEVYSTATPFEFVPTAAEITWGIGGGNNKVEVDITNGATVNVFGSFVRVRAGIDLSFMLGGYWGSTTPAIYQLAAQVAPGTGRSFGCKRSFILDNGLADGATTTIRPIPRFAKRAQVIGLDSAVAGAPFVGLLTFYLGPDVGYRHGEVLVQSNQPTPAMIPGGAMYYSVTNISGTAMLVLSVFELDI